MGWKFYDINSLPEPGDIVWCKFPLTEVPGQPGPDARPTLVLQTRGHEHPETKQQYGAVLVCYGTGQFDLQVHTDDFIVTPMAEARAIGLHKPTRFSLSSRDQKWLIWCEEWFVPPEYVAGQGLVLGRLNPKQISELKEARERRKASK